MTGHGQAIAEGHGFRVVAELRAVNGRYFKLHMRSLDGFGALEQPVEALVRSVLQRGSINATLKITGPGTGGTAELNVEVVRNYASQVANLANELRLESGATVSELLQLPGAINESADCDRNDELLWPVVETAVKGAIHNLDQMRVVEGDAMAADFDKNLCELAEYVQVIQQRVPFVVAEYQSRLADRVEQLLSKGQQLDKLNSDDLARGGAICGPL